MIHTYNALQNLINKDPYLEAYLGDVRMHLDRFNHRREDMGASPLSDIANGYMYFGIHPTQDGWVFREWLPGADKVWLIGDFNKWNKSSHLLYNIGNGVWEIKIPGRKVIKHGSHIKILVEKDGKAFERIPAYIRRTVMDTDTFRLCGQVWQPTKAFVWTDDEYIKNRPIDAPVIYEAHIGMAQEKDGVGTYREFTQKILPRIKKAGYNTIQLMAIQEHPYYASFGYQVTNFFAPSYRYGTPEELKALICKAHKLGIRVILDVVHSHACPNVGEGLNLQDGTEDQYFLPGDRGNHSAWGTKCFDYGKPEVIHFLLSNLKYWMEEYHFDGFRFDGVTSMLYENHGLGSAFTDYRNYYSLNTNVDARVYLMLANELIHEMNPEAITIAEDMSGMPGMCLPQSEAGFGFDYRLSMGVPDMWIKLIKEQPMENWDVMYIFHELSNTRPGEKSIGYAESHDQALVGDKTIIFRLADAEMYTGMMKEYHSPTMDTAIDMHKLIRMVTATLAGDGYLNFMGNEFGHPEWIDFPREGNNWSYHYARRQWSLADNKSYKFRQLADFDHDMVALLRKHRLYHSGKPAAIWLDQQKNIMIFSRGDLIFLFNMHPTQSAENVFVNCADSGIGSYRVIFSSDDEKYGGWNRISKKHTYHAKVTDSGFGFNIYAPNRTAIVIQKDQ